MGRKGLSYRLKVYLVVSLCMVLTNILISGYDMIPLLVGMYIPVIILTEFGLVRIIARHGGVEKARRTGFRERLVVNLVLILSWISVAIILGRYRFIPIIIGLLFPFLIVFDLLLIYRIFSKQQSSPGPSP